MELPSFDGKPLDINAFDSNFPKSAFTSEVEIQFCNLLKSEIYMIAQGFFYRMSGSIDDIFKHYRPTWEPLVAGAGVGERVLIIYFFFTHRLNVG